MPAQLPSRYVTSDSNGNGDLVVAVSRVDDLKGDIGKVRFLEHFDDFFSVYLQF